MKPQVFVGSSTEGLPIAHALQNNLENDAEITVWKQNVFQPSEYILESLLKQLQSTDFGIFVFSRDDLVQIRGQEQPAVRDNVIFEFGLFVGHLGRSCSVMLMPEGEALRIPSDLWGVSVLTFDAVRKDGNLEAAVGPASNRIRKLLAAGPPLKNEVLRELEIPILQRRDLLSDRQREILKMIEKTGACAKRELIHCFPQYSDGELHYRLEQLRSLMFISVTLDPSERDLGNAQYALRQSYRQARDGLRAQIPRSSPPF